MLTRLKVRGFKNLHEVDVRLGPFTCIAGPNGVGKSNLFDAIAFLSALADGTLIEAASMIRGGEARRGDVRSLFRRVGEYSEPRISFEVEMLISPQGADDLGQPAEASMTFLRYELELGHREASGIASVDTLEIVREELTHINRSEARERLGFPHKPCWRETVVKGRRTSPYISTEVEDGTVLVSLHADSAGGKGGGRPRKVPAASLPRTMLSSVNTAAEHRTLVLARQEMRSWTQLQLEPSALREPDEFTAAKTIGPTGENLPATLLELAQAEERRQPGGARDVYAQVSNRLSELVEDVRKVRVEVDEKRQLLSIVMTDRAGTDHGASALSAGTPRFLALTVMELDPRSRRLVCFEEPENGVHPLCIPAVLRLLEDLAVDPDLGVDEDNPLRQVIVNTHSPAVVACMKDHALLVAREAPVEGPRGQETAVEFRPLPGTWRCRGDGEAPVVPRDELLGYLDPLGVVEDCDSSGADPDKGTRVAERVDLQQLVFPFATRDARSEERDG